MKKRYKDLDEEKDLDLNKEDKLHKIGIYFANIFFYLLLSSMQFVLIL